ncbi:uncharacterized protein LOC116245638 isoform X3 [Nymphaea colorata]|uniref:uncharacterized protein LOC116245638 isoform X3 n=1 Tax=Nymphaea colorata TaxID=210225 RepID=UPI00129EB3F4|nr:uncharacterized protein LOC116245638 isoform X3 [Nymphaea colorata]
MVWRRFIGVGGKGLSAISVLTHGRLLLDRHYRLWVCCWAVTVEMTAGCYDYCCAFIASSVRLFKFQPARPQRLGVLSGGRSSCWAFCNMPDTHDLLPHFCLVCWWSHCIIVPTRLQGIFYVQVPTSSMSHSFVDPVLMTTWNLLEALLTPQMFVQSRHVQPKISMNKVGYRLKSPSISMFLPYVSCFYLSYV